MQGQALIDAIVAKCPQLTKPRRRFLAHILGLILAIKGRINFAQLARHSQHYCEHAMRNQFSHHLDFATLNRSLIQAYGSGHFVLALDASFLPKAGKATPGRSKFWSGTAQQALWGLEVSVLSVIDVERHTAWHLDAVQSPDKAQRLNKDITLLQHYAQVVVWQVAHCQAISAYLAVDAYFAKQPFIDFVTARTGLAIISLLRRDARLRYLHEGPATGRRGRPRQYGAYVDWHQPDFGYFRLAHQDSELRIYSAVLYCPFLKRNVKIAYTQYLDEWGWPTHYKLYFSTDVDLCAWQLVRYYRLRFQQEFLLRDAKQHTGLAHCQARSVERLDYHLNASLTAVNVAKADGLPTESGGFSLGDYKTVLHNELLLERFMSILPEECERIINHPAYEQLRYFGCKAA
jgi:hypothetical protein